VNEHLTAAVLALVIALANLARELSRQARHRRGELRTRSDDRGRACSDPDR
jgi:hypothetical protein